MHYSLRSLTLAAAATLLLAGCQQQTSQPPPPANVQVNQLSALLAGGQFLRQNCARADIPDDGRLQRTALRVAELRGWDTQATEYRQLTARAQQRYQALQQDSTPMSEKCAALNRSSARFIATAQAESR
ncbi:secretion protein [Serratia marcescens]|nr:secretion protein [Serratia marcescens]BEO41528.1 secretion protein [Serratia marcescens]